MTTIEMLMSQPAACCSVHDDLAAAAAMMWDHDCGALPVVDDDGKLAGMITDRDICMAALTQGATLASIPVTTAMAKQVFSAHREERVEHAERLMSDKQIRRIPVVDEQDRPVGVLSLNDWRGRPSRPARCGTASPRSSTRCRPSVGTARPGAAPPRDPEARKGAGMRPLRAPDAHSRAPRLAMRAMPGRDERHIEGDRAVAGLMVQLRQEVGSGEVDESAGRDGQEIARQVRDAGAQDRHRTDAQERRQAAAEVVSDRAPHRDTLVNEDPEVSQLLRESRGACTAAAVVRPIVGLTWKLAAITMPSTALCSASPSRLTLATGGTWCHRWCIPPRRSARSSTKKPRSPASTSSDAVEPPGWRSSDSGMRCRKASPRSPPIASATR